MMERSQKHALLCYGAINSCVLHCTSNIELTGNLPQWLLVEYRGWPDRLGNDTLYVTMDWRGTGEEQALEQKQDKAGKSAFSP